MFGEVRLDVVQNGLLIGDRESVELCEGGHSFDEFEESMTEVLACLGVVVSFVGDACVLNSGHNWFSVGSNVAHQ